MIAALCTVANWLGSYQGRCAAAELCYDLWGKQAASTTDFADAKALVDMMLILEAAYIWMRHGWLRDGICSSCCLQFSGESEEPMPWHVSAILWNRRSARFAHIYLWLRIVCGYVCLCLLVLHRWGRSSKLELFRCPAHGGRMSPYVGFRIM